jgi:hypothetical protein
VNTAGNFVLVIGKCKPHFVPGQDNAILLLH